MAIDLLGAMMLWATLAAVGAGNRPVVVLVAYPISTLFGIVGVSSGGLGFVEVGACGAGVVRRPLLVPLRRRSWCSVCCISGCRWPSAPW